MPTSARELAEKLFRDMRGRAGFDLEIAPAVERAWLADWTRIIEAALAEREETT
jgi:hypothetical protein